MTPNNLVFPGIKRVSRVYPIWFLIYGILLGSLVYFEIKIPVVIFLLTLFFFAKTVLLDYKIFKINRKRVYWLEHGPFHFLIVVIGIFSFLGWSYFEGIVGFATFLIALLGFLLDFIKDLKEDPVVYRAVSAQETMLK